MPTLFSFAIKNITRKPVRSWILIAAIALLVSSLVFSMSFVERVSGSIKKTSERLGADLIIVPTGSRGAAEEVLLENQSKSFYMDGSVIGKLGKIDGIDAMTEQTYLVTFATMCCTVPEAMVVAFNQDTDFIIRPWLKEKLGRRLEKGEAVAGFESSFNIRLGLVDVDSKLFGNVFRLVGSLDKTGTGLDNAVFIGQENLGSIIEKGTAKLKKGQVSVIFAKVKPGVSPNKVAAAIEDSIIEVDAVARKDIGKSIIATLKDVRHIFILTSILASVLSLFLVWSIFSAIANERSREVGIMRALGAKESHVVRLFFLEVLVIGCAGGILGAAVGTSFTLALGNSFSILRNLANDLGGPERLLIAAASFATGAVICVAGALSPIARIKKLEPLVVMKAE
jgi:putative ABC transport system permease protein